MRHEPLIVARRLICTQGATNGTLLSALAACVARGHVTWWRLDSCKGLPPLGEKKPAVNAVVDEPPRQNLVGIKDSMDVEFG